MTTSHPRLVVTAALAVVGLAVATGCSGPSDPVPPHSGPQATSAVAQSGSAASSGSEIQPLAAPIADPAAGSRTASSPGSTAAPASPNPQRRVITVTGVGTVTGTPDTLTVQLGVQTRADSASAALQNNNAKAADVISALRKHGVAAKDLQTSQLSINPTYTNDGNSITGYEVSNFVTATLHDIGKAGALIDAAQQAAGNAIRLNQVSFSFADDSSLRAKARADAVKHALAQAGQLAHAADLTLGQVLSITEGPDYSSPKTVYAAASAAAAGPAPVMPGQQDLTVQVQVVVAIG